MDGSFAIDPLNMTKIDAASSLSSRQKSCNACVRGKRRCDKRTPRCTRCAAKGLDCVYHKMPPAQSRGDAGRNSPPATLRQQQSGSTTPEMADVPDFDMGFDYESLGTETSPESMCQMPDQVPTVHQQQHNHHQSSHNSNSNNNNNTHLHLGPGLDFDINDFMNAVPNAHAQAPTLTPPSAHGNANSFFASLFETTTTTTATGGTSKLDIPPVTVPFMSTALVAQPQKSPMRDLSLLQRNMACHGGYDPLTVHDERSWMGYTVRSLTSMHKTFAQTRALPFLHARLWATNLPKPILSVFSAATAYANRSDDNRAWIMKLLSDTAVSVHRDGEQASTPADKLARVQALVILDSMRVFDGDVGLRAAAEREAHVLSAWIGELQQVTAALEQEAMDHAAAQPGATTMPTGMEGLDSTATSGMGAGGSAYPSRDRPPKNWEAWMLLESARRTLLFSCAFVCMNKLLKSQDVTQSMWTNLRFTASRHLWEAPSSVEFFRSWRDKPQYFIRDFDFKDFWSYARPDDMDEFTKVMLMPQIGMDTLEHFMAEDSSSMPVA